MSSKLQRYFSTDGVLARALPGYQARPQQATVAQAVANSITTPGGISLIEAATGVGKTFAYLIPALQYARPDRKVIISTHTLALQGQLLEKDLPLMQTIMKAEVDAVLMKGRGNYLCLQDLDVARGDIWTIGDSQFAQINEWSRTSSTGDMAELDFNYPGWQDIRANVDTCRANECRYYENCFYYGARRNANDASIIVVNHALFFHDLAMRQRGEFGGTLLPDYSFVVFDEAHHLETAAAAAFGVAFSSSRIPQILERLRRVGRTIELDRDRMRALEAANQALFAPFGATSKQDFLLDDILQGAEPMQEAKLHVANISNLADTISTGLLKLNLSDDDGLKDRVDGIRRQFTRAKEEIQLVIGGNQENFLRWGSLSRGGRRGPSVTLNWTPVSLGPLLGGSIWATGRTVGAALVSATLATDGGFKYLRERLGIAPDDFTVTETIVGSTFDYKSQCLLYVPPTMPLPNDDASFGEAVFEQLQLLVAASNGGAFLLFTSHRAMTAAYERFLELHLPYPLFKQGEMPNARLVEAYKAVDNGVLFGTFSFWEGVDVPGDLLRLVVIDRIPFAMPDSPLHRARVEKITAAGGDWFGEYALPQAEIRLKQGFGRLIRSHSDRGVVALLDARLLRKNYGSRILRSLPPAPRTGRIDDVQRFFAADKAVQESAI